MDLFFLFTPQYFLVSSCIPRYRPRNRQVFLFSAPSADEASAPTDTASSLRVRLQQIIARLTQSAVADLVDWTSLLVALPGGPFGANGAESRVVRALASPLPWVRELAGYVLLRLLKYEPRIGSWPILGGTGLSPNSFLLVLYHARCY